MILEDGKNSVNCSPPVVWSTAVIVKIVEFYTVRTESQEYALNRRAEEILDATNPFRIMFPKFDDKWITP